VGSIHGFLGSNKRFYDGLDFRRGGAAYQTAKGGVINLTRHLAAELGEYGITANCISPGQVPRPDADPEFVERGRLNVPPERGRLNVPLERVGTPGDLKGAVVLLASPAGSWITGHNLVVDGGLSVW
jgi:gluconate 5-dehydrogenase